MVKTPKNAKVRTSAQLLQKAVAGKGKATQALFVINAYAVGGVGTQLEEAGVKLDKTVEFESNDVYVFTKDELVAVLKKGNLYVFKKALSDTQNVEWVWLKTWPKLPATVLSRMGTPSIEAVTQRDVEVHGTHSDATYAFIISSMLSPLLKRRVKMTVPHAHPAEYSPDGPFQIYIWSTPGTMTEREARVPEEIWGIRTWCRDAAYIPKEGRTPAGILLDDFGYPVAELLPNALYVHHDLVHNHKNEELELFAEILRRCQPALMGPEAFAKYKEEEKARRLEAEKNAFPLLVERSVTKRATRQKGAVETAQRLATLKKSEYFEAERALFAERQILLDPEVMKTRFLAEYEKLQSGGVEMIEGVTFNPSNNGSITLHTGEILVEHPRKGTVHLIGKCDATYDLETGGVRIVNRDHAYRSDGGTVIHTPHVFDENGTNVCLGNIRQELVAYIAHYELEAAAVLTVAFLQSCLDSSSYIARLEKFAVVNRKEREAA